MERQNGQKYIFFEQNLNSNMKNVSDIISHHPLKLIDNQTKSIYLFEIDNCEVIEILNNLDNLTLSGQDEICNVLAKKTG